MATFDPSLTMHAFEYLIAQGFIFVGATLVVAMFINEKEDQAIFLPLAGYGLNSFERSCYDEETDIP